MAESNKILTVSYGTFSCTLEGFDDAFTTMKAIAEYFRDLAADDRFFGAEPPTPDADMLARLASRTSSRRVEARQDENGITLRQETAALSAPSTTPAPTSAPTSAPAEDDAEPVTDGEPTPDPDRSDIAEEVAETPVADDATVSIEHAEEDEVAEAIAEIEAVAEAGDAVASDTDDADDDTPGRRVLARNASAVIQRRAKPAKVRVTPNRPRVAVSTGRPARPAVAQPAPAPHPDQTSVAAKLARIRGVVAKTGRADAATGYTEDQHAEGGQTEDAAAALARAFDADAAQDATDAAAEAADEAATRAAIAAELAERAQVDEGDTEDDADDQDASLDEELDLSAAMAIANAPGEDEDEVEDEGAETGVAAVDEDDDADDSFDEEAFFADISDDDDEDDDVAAAPDAPAADMTGAEPAARPVARVLKVKRRDFEAAVRDGALEEDEAEEVAIPEAITRGESSLSPEDEAELQSELQALEAEIARGIDQDEDEDDAVAEDTSDEVAEEEDIFAALEEDEEDEDDTAAMSWDMDADDDEDDDDRDTGIGAAFDDADDADEADIAAEAEDDTAEDDAADARDDTVNPRRRLLRGADDDMDRILKETDNQLGDSDGTRRRSAIAHLRAAVAATKAEKQAGAVAEDDEQEVTDAYRDDLAQVVRPRRPALRGDAPSRRAEDRPAPLKLVAEQRVDIPGTDTGAGPVRPRRVRMSDLAKSEKVAEAEVDSDAEAHARAAAANAASFNEFAERVGAVDLPDLLEAAASYLSFVEGRDQFTRPQLMVKARQALEDEFSREDGLRHFGRLLREGKLRKVAPGHFSVSDRINFRPEERAAG